ncbi:hypothetical protein M758_1G163600 [Ceratodon purpureus]|nr:hypothetical protein M758_1G163600 [Ceratodon purpureus]KAG0630225.1 hypothetical protein M758_1G163600 [Ceratodon purpureus]
MRELGGMTMEVDVAIVGGGMGGLALAVGLQERGIKAHVFEKSPKERKHFGTGISIGQNGIQALEGIKPGLSQKMESEGQRTRQFTARIRVQGEPEKVFTQLPQLTESEVMFTVAWKGALETLADELDPSVVHYRHSFVDYKLVEEGVESRFEVRIEQDSDACTVETNVVKAKLLVGADGVWSGVRKLVVGDEPRDLCLVTWLSVVRTERIRSLNLNDDDEIRFIVYPATKTGVITCSCGPEYTHWQYRVPDESRELMKSFTSDFNAHGKEARKMRILKQLEGVEELQNLKTAVERSESHLVREDRNFDRLPVSSWSDSSGHVVLLGDAAHAFYPGPGMGARIAFEDAHQLSLLLHEAFSSSTPETTLPDAVKRFEEVRIPRCTKLQRFAAELTSWPSYIPESVQKLSPGEKAQRTKEFYRWLNKYPKDMVGDPDSTYWKPEQV